MSDNLDLIHEQTGFIKTAFGGTELMLRRLYRDMPRELLEKFQIIPTRVNALDEEKVRVLWIHDLSEDPSCDHLKNGGWMNFHKLVFVSYWQQQHFINKFQIPWSRTTVLRNAVEPIDVDAIAKWNTQKEKVRLVYHTTPHRGLEIVVPVFKKLVEKYGDKIELGVYSSYGVYGWAQRDKEYQNVFDSMKDVPQIHNYGAVPNEEIRKILPEYDIFTYPSIWPETSCLALIEAMSASLICIHSSLGALHETGSNWSMMYDMHEDPNHHASIHYKMLDTTIDVLLNREPGMFKDKQPLQKQYIDSFYNWNLRKIQWQAFLSSIQHSNTEIPEIKQEEVFSYNV